MERRGKFLIFLMDNGDRMFLHLRMTGQLFVTPPDYPMEKHTHLLIHFENEKQMRYIDVRRFGRFWYIKKEEDESITGIDKLGPEPFDKEFTSAYLKGKLEKKKKPIKEMLHDQSVVAGIGNIYSDEILYAAGIHPETRCTELTENEWNKLAKIIPEILTWAIEKKQIAQKEYRNVPFLKAYGHQGKECPICGSVFERVVVGGRSSCYCPGCQRKKE